MTLRNRAFDWSSFPIDWQEEVFLAQLHQRAQLLEKAFLVRN